MRNRRILERIDGTGEFDRSPEKKVFDSLVGEIGPQMEQAGIRGPDDFKDYGKTEDFLAGLRLVVRYSPGLKFLGEGSSRYVYAMGSGKYVLKAAKNAMGLMQNRNEIAVNKSGSADYDCFVRILKYDPSEIFIVEDACEKIQMSQWQPLIGVTLQRFVQILRIVTQRREKDKAYTMADLLAECRLEGESSQKMHEIFRPDNPMEPTYERRDFAGIVSVMENLVEASSGRPPSETWRSLFDIFRFYFDNGAKKLVFGELPWSEQWGLCGEGANRRIVLVDPGVSEDFQAAVAY